MIFFFFKMGSSKPSTERFTPIGNRLIILEFAYSVLRPSLSISSCFVAKSCQKRHFSVAWPLLMLEKAIISWWFIYNLCKKNTVIISLLADDLWIDMAFTAAFTLYRLACSNDCKAILQSRWLSLGNWKLLSILELKV